MNDDRIREFIGELTLAISRNTDPYMVNVHLDDDPLDRETAQGRSLYVTVYALAPSPRILQITRAISLVEILDAQDRKTHAHTLAEFLIADLEAKAQA